MDEQLIKNEFKQEKCIFESAENITVEILAKNNEEKLPKSNLIHGDVSEVPALPKNAPEIYDKEYFDKLFDWNTIEEQLKEPNIQFSKKQLKNDDEMSLESQNLKEQCSVKLREKQFSTTRSEAERKRKSKDLLQNRRSTGFLSFEDVEKVIKEIEEIGLNIQKNLTSAKNDPESDTGSAEKKSISDEIIEETSGLNMANINNSEYGSVQLREKKSSPYNSAASRKRRSRNLLLNRRSTGYVSAEDVEKAKSIDQQDDDVHLDLDD